MAAVKLSLHKPLKGAFDVEGDAPASVDVDIDQDSSVSPKPWVAVQFTDEDNDAVTIRLNAQEALQLSQRIGDAASAIL